ncbi:ParM/StbA family protein [Alicyclobacillus cycloheptanicus]|uniref:Plasmid segregation protein ParM n=1 Tax=Alicyclobacillus cycloheptanicus TaxID=1457 RepID=A0ABT9XLU1_9BACL|nr:ParM/StbA family protein [Alicyclobacillus cycloheptanicus]MDQ0191277.1 plasmid segregation protein ParM [Alicyclobacillus cycloheptanicus]WDM00449.1 ParM/StbA family protein [Alicyclobacillus cycloheptanicus]
MQKARIAAVDAGNDAAKAVIGDTANRLVVPNVIAVERERRQVVQLEADPLDGLHVEVISPALRGADGIYAVGNLATMYRHSTEVPADAIKAESNQNLVVALTTLAIDAVLCGQFSAKKGVIQATYDLACGLPLAEVKAGRKQGFIERLKEGPHKVRFLDTPAPLGGNTVSITFGDVRVYAEGHAAIADITMDDEGRPRRVGIEQLTILVADIGGVTSDFCIIGSRGHLDNVNSVGLQDGISPCVDGIMARVEQEAGYRFRNRQELVRCITDPREDRRYRVGLGRMSIKGIVDEELDILARVEYQQIRKLFAALGGQIEICFVIGGGGILLRPYLEALNVDKLPLRFITPEESVWANAKGYYKLLQMARKIGAAK